uniref:Putative dna-directed rna polymerase iii subunit rpc31 n=1 Tax=Anopheles marajoara TaxID=58244 RepID=A0A2M4C5M2_9DIPT
MVVLVALVVVLLLLVRSRGTCTSYLSTRSRTVTSSGGCSDTVVCECDCCCCCWADFLRVPSMAVVAEAAADEEADEQADDDEDEEEEEEEDDDDEEDEEEDEAEDGCRTSVGRAGLATTIPVPHPPGPECFDCPSSTWTATGDDGSERTFFCPSFRRSLAVFASKLIFRSRTLPAAVVCVVAVVVCDTSSAENPPGTFSVTIVRLLPAAIVVGGPTSFGCCTLTSGR